MTEKSAPPKVELSISSDDQCWDAYWAIKSGDLQPLIEYLDRETGIMNPLLQRELAELLNGEHRTYRLELKPSKRGAGRPKEGLASRYLADKALLALDDPASAVGHYADPEGEVRKARHRLRKAFDRLKAFDHAHRVGQRSKN